MEEKGEGLCETAMCPCAPHPPHHPKTVCAALAATLPPSTPGSPCPHLPASSLAAAAREGGVRGASAAARREVGGVAARARDTCHKAWGVWGCGCVGGNAFGIVGVGVGGSGGGNVFGNVGMRGGVHVGG